MMKAYFIPGLAADQRVFRHTRLPENYAAVYLEWIKPETNESLKDYALRLAGQINTTEPFILIGLSFGGMIAVEIAKEYHPDQLILIASIAHHRHLPAWYRMAYKTGMHKVIGVNMLKKAVYLKRYFTSETFIDKAIVKQMARDMDPEFIRWAIRAIVQWKTDDRVLKLHHIHGTRDFILPGQLTHAQYKISGAGHLMIFNRAEEINRILFSILQ